MDSQRMKSWGTCSSIFLLVREEFLLALEVRSDRLGSILKVPSGYETTANAITYGILMLALRPDLQEKVIQEIDFVYATAEDEGRAELSYKHDFPRLQYTYGFMVNLALLTFLSHRCS